MTNLGDFFPHSLKHLKKKLNLKLGFYLLCLLFLAATPPINASKRVLTEPQLKAVFLYKFSLFTRWPEKNFLDSATFNLCIMGESPFNSELDKAVQNEYVQGRAVRLLHINLVENALECHILFISKSEHHRYKSILIYLENDPVLTVSSLNGFVKNGGAIQFYNRNNKVHFIISPAVAKKKKITISSNLLSVATIFSEETPND